MFTSFFYSYYLFLLIFENILITTKINKIYFLKNLCINFTTNNKLTKYKKSKLIFDLNLIHQTFVNNIFINYQYLYSYKNFCWNLKNKFLFDNFLLYIFTNLKHNLNYASKIILKNLNFLINKKINFDLFIKNLSSFNLTVFVNKLTPNPKRE